MTSNKTTTCYWENKLKQFFKNQDISWLNLSESEAVDFLDYAFEQGIEPIFCHLLKTFPTNESFNLIKNRLATKSIQYNVLQALIEKETKVLLHLFSENNIDSLLLKGVPLSYTHYPEPSLRPFSDVDIFIKQQDLAKILTLMKEAGYQTVKSISGQTIAHQMVFYKIINEKLKIYFDIHWAISNRPIFSDIFSFEDLWKNKIFISRLSPNAYTLNSCDSLLFACVHRASHYDENRVIWLYDIHLLIESMNYDEQSEFLAQAIKKKLTKICFQSLSLAKDWFNTKTSSETLTTLSNVTNYEPSEIYTYPAQTPLRLFLSNFGYIKGMDKLRFLKEVCFPPSEYMLNKYGVSNKLLLPFLYLRRMLSGMKRWF